MKSTTFKQLHCGMTAFMEWYMRRRPKMLLYFRSWPNHTAKSNISCMNHFKAFHSIPFQNKTLWNIQFQWELAFNLLSHWIFSFEFLIMKFHFECYNISRIFFASITIWSMIHINSRTSLNYMLLNILLSFFFNFFFSFYRPTNGPNNGSCSMFKLCAFQKWTRKKLH